MSRLLSAPGLKLCLAALVLACGCNSTNPVEPTGGTTPPAGGGSYAITLTADREFLPVGSTDPATITVSVKTVSTNAPASGLTCGLTTSLGSFSASTSSKVVSLTLDSSGTATAKIYPGSDSGTATLLAQVDTSVAQLDLPVRQSTVFISSVAPNRGVAEGGETVRIRGGGFVTPLRVSFGGVPSPKITYRSAELVEAVTPRSPTPVDANTTLTVSLSLSVAIDKPNAPSDTLSDGFTYTSGTDPIDRPVIFSLSPDTGPNEGGQEVTIFGAFLPTTTADAQVLFGFSSGTTFDGLEAAIVSASSTQIKVITPRASGIGASLQNKQVDVQVRNRSTGFFTISRTIYRYRDDVFITDVQPRSASAVGGDTVTITGRGFQSPVNVFLAGQQATVTAQPSGCGPTGNTQCTIQVTTPAVSANSCAGLSGPVMVTNLGTGVTATSSIVFTFTTNALQLNSLTPSSGPATGSTPVMIFGSGFRTGSTPRVTFNGVTATAVSVNTSTNISATTPAFTGSFDTETCTTSGGASGTRYKSKAVDVKVTDLTSSCNDTLSGAFTYVPTDTSCRADSLAPVANFTYDTVPGQPLQIRFINQSTGGRGKTFHWVFGDGTTSSQETPTHNYAVAGSYLVTFTLSNDAGTSSVSKQITVPLPVSPQTDPKRKRW